ncbi:MAG: iron chaperone [Phycisphaerales bacterium]
MQSKAATVQEYIASLPPDRAHAVEALRKVIKKNLKGGYAEGMSYGMIGYAVPHSIYPRGYHCDPTQPLPFAGIGSQKNHISLYLFCLYTDEARVQRFREQWLATGRKLDMGKSCVRFKKLEDIPLDLIARTIADMPVKQFIAQYEAMFPPKPSKAPPATKKAASKKTTKKKTTKKPTPAKQAAQKAAKKATKEPARKSPTRRPAP